MRAFITSCISALLTAACAPAAEPGEPFPPFALPGLLGVDEVRFPELCGRVVQVELWGSWCGPCVDSMVAADRLRRSLARDDFAVVGISLDADADAAAAFLNLNPVEFPNAWDAAREVQTSLRVDGVPTVLLVDRSGWIRARFDGFNSSKDERLQAIARSLLEEPPLAGDCPGN